MLGVDARKSMVGSVTATGAGFGRGGGLLCWAELTSESSSSEESKSADSFPDLALSLGDEPALSPKLELLP